MKRIWLLVLLGLVQFVIVAPVSADGGTNDRVVMGGSVVVDSEDVVGDLVVLGGSTTVLGRVAGDLVVFGGSASISGKVQGALIVFGGSVDLTDKSSVGEDVVVFGGTLKKAEGAQVGGTTVRGNEGVGFALPGLLSPSFRLDTSPIWGFFWGLFKGVFATIALLALGVLAVVFFPSQLEVTEEVMETSFWQSAGVGALTLVICLLQSPILIISLIGIPVFLLLWLIVFFVALYALVATANLVGERVLRSTSVRSMGPVAFVLVGTILIMAVIIPFNAISGGCLGTMLLLLLTMPGTGAAILSRFGTTFWRPGAAGRPPLPPSSRIFPPPPSQPPPAQEPGGLAE